MSTRQCIFCKIGQDLQNKDAVYRDQHVFVLRDVNPRAPVHLLIIPNDHVASLAYVGPDQEPSMGHLLAVAEDMARRQGLNLSGFRLVINQGQDAGQQIEHLHMHLLGGRKLSAMG